jgi:hypothetical protein
MRLTKSILLSILSIPVILAQPAAEAGVIGAEFDFQELLAVLPAESLHAALHKHVDEKFQDGVFEHERNAVEKVHNEDPGTATKVLAEAALHLLKRQNNNDTIATTTPTTTDDPTPPPPTTPTTTTSPTVIIPIDVTTTNSEGEGTTLRTSVVADPTVSIPQTVTTTNEEGSTVTQSTNVPAAIVTQDDGQVTTQPAVTFTPSTADPTRATDVTTTNSVGNTVVLPSVTPGAVVTATDQRGSVFVTTYTPDGGTVSSLVLRTTQLPDGRLSTITSFAIVAAATDTSASSSGSPRLQSAGNSLRTSSANIALSALAVLCGAIAATAFLL